jgi:D-arginine dehydrogenase
VIDVEETFYFRPDAGGLMISPADETPSDPCDAQADELDIAVAIDHFEQATTETVRRVAHRWAGLRTFAPDRIPIVGADPREPAFFWLAGQGGYGIQTAPGLGAAVASLLTTGELQERLCAEGLSAADLGPGGCWKSRDTHDFPVSLSIRRVGKSCVSLLFAPKRPGSAGPDRRLARRC